MVSAGELFGEIAFFTEVPQLECVKAATVVRVLTIPRAAYNGTAAAFPLGSRSVLDNLRVKAQQVGSRAYPPRIEATSLPANLDTSGPVNWIGIRCADHQSSSAASLAAVCMLQACTSACPMLRRMSPADGERPLRGAGGPAAAAQRAGAAGQRGAAARRRRRRRRPRRQRAAGCDSLD
jgi:hypothetical protein